MNICEECDLPIKVCNMRGMYEKSRLYLRIGRIEEAKRLADAADECWFEYMVELGDQRVHGKQT